METLAIVVGALLAIFIGGVEIILLYLMISGKIDLQRLISEPSGDASMSRFQFLVFTVVIAMCFFLIVVSNNPPGFPTDIPASVVGLLGVSGGSYVISKGIQVNRDVSLQKLAGAGGNGNPPPANPPANPPNPPQG